MRSKWVRIAIIVGAMGMGVPVTPSFAEPSAAPASRVPEKKLTITGLENGVTVTAQFNPKEITIDFIAMMNRDYLKAKMANRRRGGQRKAG